MGILKVCKFIDTTNVEIIATNKEFEYLYEKINLKYMGITYINNDSYQVYYSFKTSKYYIVNPE